MDRDRMAESRAWIYKSKGLLLLIGIITLLYCGFKIARPNNFGTLANMLSYFEQCLMPSVAACGFYFIIVMGLFDFSLGANIVLSAIAGCILADRFGYAGLIAGSVLCGTIIGLLNGVVYIKLRIPSIIATIGLLMLYESIGVFLAGGKVLVLEKPFRAFGAAPFNIVLALSAFLLAYVLLKYSKIGTYVTAIGSNEKIAKSMGILTDRYKVIGFLLCGSFAGIMSILTISYGTAIVPASNMASMSRNFTPLMGCFFGVALKKYISPVISIVAGEFMIALMLNGLIALGVPTTIQDVAIGFVLLIIVASTTRVKKGEVVK